MRSSVPVGLIVVGGMLVAGLASALPSQDPDLHEQAPPAAPAEPAAPAQGGAAAAPVAGEPVKFCPVGGESYPAEITYCPEHGVELKPKN